MSAQTFVKSFTHLTDKPRAKEALEILQKLASLVKPIMRKHGWILPVLSEFYPDNASLLGMNMNYGEKILIRLRQPFDASHFLQMPDIIGTMLHELTHNQRGPHDEVFYKIMAGLQDEYDELQRNNYSGEGFFSNGHKLGTSRDLPLYRGRERALEAAMKRKQNSQILGGGSGRKVGGLNSQASLRELAAKAAERRIQDEKTCVHGADAVKEANKAAKQSVATEVIDLTSDDGAPGPSTPKKSKVQPPPKPNFSTRPVTANSKPKSLTLGPECQICTFINTAGSTECVMCCSALPIGIKPSWTCHTCTYLNPATVRVCEVCNVARLGGRSNLAGWTCGMCMSTGNPIDLWACQVCEALRVA